MDVDEQQLRSDPKLLSKVLHEWRTFHEVIGQSPLSFCIYDENQNLISWNAAYQSEHSSAFKLNPAAARMGRLNYRDVLHAEQKNTLPLKEQGAKIRASAPSSIESDDINQQHHSAGQVGLYRQVLKSGGVASLSMGINDFHAVQGQLAGAQSKFAQEGTCENERLSLAAKLVGFGSWEWDIKHNKAFFDARAHEVFGTDPITFDQSSFDIYQIAHIEDRHLITKAFAQVLRGATELDCELRIIKSNGKVRIVRINGVLVRDKDGVAARIIGAVIDLTDSRNLQKQIAQSQRMEAIGNLTGGVAHDFNNLLAIILGNLELSMMCDDIASKQELTEEAIKATNRAAELTKNLLSFARRAHLTPTRLNLNDLVDATVKWSSRVLPASLAIETSLSSGLWDTDLDASSAENAVVNLLLNARDAMPDGGNLTIETTNIHIGSEYIADRQEDITPGRYVMLAVSDTGHGIPSDKLAQVFEPFYSGKPTGQGSGLGLSMVQGFVKQSKGAIRVYSEVGVGTTVKIFLRVSDGDPNALEIAEPEAAVSALGGVRVLIAEDDLDVSRVLQGMLEGANHIVTLAANGDEAYELFMNSGPFDVLMTDIVMPGALQGPELAKAIRAISPDFPCIFLSGYAAEATVHGNGLQPSDIRLMKPVQRADLLNNIARAMLPKSDGD